MVLYFPVFLNLKNKRCLVIGGGQVASRKVGSLLEHEAEVTVVSPEVCSELRALVDSRQIAFIERTFEATDLSGCWLAIAATDNREANIFVSSEARKARVLVNVVDDAENSDFIFPSYVRQGDIAIAISTSGRSPALARKLRAKMEKEFGPEYAVLTSLMGDLRREYHELGKKIEAERWQEALDLESAIKLIKQGHVEDARNMLKKKLEKPDE